MNPRSWWLAALFALPLATGSGPAVFVNVRKKYVDANATGLSAAPRVHGGYEAPEGRFKFMVFLLASHSKYPTLTCSASLIAERWVLTAAHCVMPRHRPPAIIAIAGKANLFDYYQHRKSVPFHQLIDGEFYGVQERKVARVFVNPDYSEVTNERDLALLLLEKPFRLDDSVQKMDISRRKMRHRLECTVLGWGLNEQQYQSFKLMYVEQVLAQTPDISCRFRKSGPYICLEEGGPGICKGDSGSPLVCNNMIWGVSSFALSDRQDPKCGEAEEEYYCQIYPDLQWMDRVMAAHDAAASSYVHFFGIALVLVNIAWALSL